MDQYIGELRIFSCNFAPRSWAYCNGQLLPIAQNTALFSLLGTMYGGDGRVTFGLPNLQGQAAVGQGQGPGLSLYVIGGPAGSETVTLTPGQQGPHTHNVACYNAEGSDPLPANTVLASSGADRSNVAYVVGSSGSLVPMSPNQIGPTGSFQPHNNMSPYLTLSYCIALEGIYPPRS